METVEKCSKGSASGDKVKVRFVILATICTCLLVGSRDEYF